jgi:hypothetical protein
MSRQFRIVTATVAATAVLVAVPAVRASAATPVSTGAAAYATAAGTGSGSLSANLHLSGALGGLLDGLISPIVNTALNPLVTALTGTVNSVVAGVLGSASAANAGTPSQQFGTTPAAFPNETFPSPCTSSGSQPCFQLTNGNAVNAPPLATVGLGLITGYTQQVPSSADATNPIFGRARIASASVSVLPGVPSIVSPLVSTGVIDAKANCPNDGPVGASKPNTRPTAMVSATGVSLLGGQITLSVLNGQIANLVVAGTPYTIGSLPVLNVSGVTVAPYGTSLIVTIPLSPTAILNGLGLPSSALTQLLGFTPTSTLAVKLVVGPNSNVTSTSAQAWGLGVGVDLSGSLGFNLLGLVGATVSVPSGIGGGNSGNLLDLRLGYATCQSGVSTTVAPPPVPPALI